MTNWYNLWFITSVFEQIPNRDMKFENLFIMKLFHLEIQPVILYIVIRIDEIFCTNRVWVTDFTQR